MQLHALELFLILVFEFHCGFKKNRSEPNGLLILFVKTHETETSLLLEVVFRGSPMPTDFVPANKTSNSLN